RRRPPCGGPACASPCPGGRRRPPPSPARRPVGAVPRLRLGVAVPVPSPVAAEVDVLRRACGAADVERIPAHCTLVPPVNVREDRLDDAVDVLRAAAAATRPFDVTLGPPGSFLPTNPVLYLALSEGADAVRRL